VCVAAIAVAEMSGDGGAGPVWRDGVWGGGDTRWTGAAASRGGCEGAGAGGNGGAEAGGLFGGERAGGVDGEWGYGAGGGGIGGAAAVFGLFGDAGVCGIPDGAAGL
jgi:hypothetical protein